MSFMPNPVHRRRKKAQGLFAVLRRHHPANSRSICTRSFWGLSFSSIAFRINAVFVILFLLFNDKCFFFRRNSQAKRHCPPFCIATPPYRISFEGDCQFVKISSSRRFCPPPLVLLQESVDDLRRLPCCAWEPVFLIIVQTAGDFVFKHQFPITAERGFGRKLVCHVKFVCPLPIFHHVRQYRQFPALFRKFVCVLFSKSWRTFEIPAVPGRNPKSALAGTGAHFQGESQILVDCRHEFFIGRLV